jgi:hypothetical protein
MGQVPAHQVDAHRECPGVRRSRVDVSTTRRKKLLDQPTSHFSLEPPPLRSWSCSESICHSTYGLHERSLKSPPMVGDVSEANLQFH